MRFSLKNQLNFENGPKHYEFDELEGSKFELLSGDNEARNSKNRSNFRNFRLYLSPVSKWNEGQAAVDDRADVEGTKGEAVTGSGKEYMAYDKSSGVSAA